MCCYAYDRRTVIHLVYVNIKQQYAGNYVLVKTGYSLLNSDNIFNEK